MSEAEVVEMVVRLNETSYLDRRIGGVWGTGAWKWQYRCKCGLWCWEDWNNCPACGKLVVKTSGDFFRKENDMAMMLARDAHAGNQAAIGDWFQKHFNAGTLPVIARYFGNEGSQQVSDAVAKARAAGVPWLQIFSVLLPLILSLFSGGTIDLQAIIAAILALITPPAAATK